MDRFVAALRNIIRQTWPELGHGTHLPLKARVTAVHGDAGRVDSITGPCRYSVDVLPLRPDGNVDPTRPPLRDVPLEVIWAGPNRGLFALPHIGATVRVCFYGGSAAHPYIDGIVADTFDVPSVQPGEYLLQHSPGVEIRVLPDGRVHVKSTTDVLVESATQATVDAPEVHVGPSAIVHLADGGPAVVRDGDPVVNGVVVATSTRVFSG